jgi:acetyltransferase-like isoleucine patch superfamily enzyme
VSRRRPDARFRSGIAHAVRRSQRVRRLTGLGGRVIAGPHTYFDAPPVIKAYAGDTALVKLGAFCSVAEDVEFLVGGEHRVDWITTFPLRAFFGLPGMLRDGHPAPAEDIEIGNDVWIGTGACILSGVRIGDGAVIGARAVVTKDVREYAIVGGNPAREIRRRFPDDIVELLRALRWWDWPLDEILENVDVLSSPNVEELARIAAQRTS